jgi:hypothetical protein
MAGAENPDVGGDGDAAGSTARQRAAHTAEIPKARATTWWVVGPASERAWERALQHVGSGKVCKPPWKERHRK